MTNFKKTWNELPAVTKTKLNMIAKCILISPYLTLEQGDQDHDKEFDVSVISKAFYESGIFGEKVSLNEVMGFTRVIFELNDMGEDSPEEQKKLALEKLNAALKKIDYGFEDNEQYWQDRDIYETDAYVRLAEKLGLKNAHAVKTFLKDTDAKESFVRAFSEAVEKANNKDHLEDDYDYS